MTYMTTKNREIIRMALTPDAKRKLDEIADGKDMKLIGIMSRLVEWLVEQDQMTQSLVLGLVPKKDMPDIIELLYKKYVIKDELGKFGTEYQKRIQKKKQKRQAPNEK